MKTDRVFPILAITILLSFVAFGLLSTFDAHYWHSKGWPWSTYQFKGPWHNCVVSAWGPKESKLTCTEGELRAAFKPVKSLSPGSIDDMISKHDFLGWESFVYNDSTARHVMELLLVNNHAYSRTSSALIAGCEVMPDTASTIRMRCTDLYPPGFPLAGQAGIKAKEEWQKENK